MPTPIGHTLAGVLIGQHSGWAREITSGKSVLVAVVLANLADIDLLPGLLVGNPNKFHHTITHSFGITILVGILFGVYTKLWRKSYFMSAFIFASLAYFSHVALDFLCADKSSPIGIPLLWPFSDEYMISPVVLFASVSKDSVTATFIKSLFVWHNLWTVLREIVILGSLLIISWWRKYRSSHNSLNTLP